MTRLLLLLCACIISAGCGQPPTVGASSVGSIAVQAPFQRVVVAQPTIAPGGEQAISVTLELGASTTTVLQLEITYTGGTTQDVLDQTVGSTATLNWLVPDDAQSGEAKFRLKSSGCGCGDRSSATGPTDIESTVEGHFFVQ
ncbi:MAG: hypothetical protein U0X20_27755 [Caldilineaceae bacterium]